jgi:hypothetical protein
MRKVPVLLVIPAPPLKLNALKGQAKVARGKRESESAPPRVTGPENLPLKAKPRDSANPICG